jgi:hypothetical protein
MNIYQPYTYLIGWSAIDRWYYGVRYAKNCHPEDFWKVYFTSSSYVAQMRELLGDPDIIQIRKTFTTADAACLWEHNVLTRMNVIESKRWLNQIVGFGSRAVMSESHRRKISIALTGKKLSPEHRIKCGDARRGKHHTQEHKAYMSGVMSGRTLSEEHKKNLSKVNKGRKRSTETLEKMSAAVSGKRWVNNGVECKMMRELPEGWQYGRISNKNKC